MVHAYTYFVYDRNKGMAVPTPIFTTFRNTQEHYILFYCILLYWILLKSGIKYWNYEPKLLWQNIINFRHTKQFYYI